MASLLNSAKNTNTSFTGHWEDTKDYNSVILTLQSPFDGSGHLQWANTTRRNFPTDDDIIAQEEFLYQRSEPVTKQWDHRGRWFRFVYNDIPARTLPNYYDMCLNIETMYKRDATELKIANDSQTITTVQQGDIDSAYQIVLTDSSGVKLRTTQEKKVQANFTVIHSQINHSTITINGIGYAKPDESSRETQQDAQYTALFTEGVAYEVTGTTILKNNQNYPPYLPARSEVDSVLIIIEEGSFTIDGTNVSQRRAPSGSSNMIRLDEDEIRYRDSITGEFPIHSDGTPRESTPDVTIETDTGRFYEENGNFYFIIGQKSSIADFVPLKQEALYVTPREDSENSLAFTEKENQTTKSLFVGLRDNENNNFSSTSEPTSDVSSLYIHPSNEHGYSQASTAKVHMEAGENGTDGVALYLAAAGEKQGITSTFEFPTEKSDESEGNSLAVHLIHKQGRAVDADAPLPVTSVGNIGQSSPFDISSGVEEAFTTFCSGGNAQISLVNLFLYNDGPVVTWTKLYDICSGQLSQATVNFSVVSVEYGSSQIWNDGTRSVIPVPSSRFNTSVPFEPTNPKYLEAMIHYFQLYFRLGSEQNETVISNEFNHTAVLNNNVEPRSDGRMGTLPSSLSVSTNTNLPVSYATVRYDRVHSSEFVYDQNHSLDITQLNNNIHTNRDLITGIGTEYVVEFSIGRRDNQIVVSLLEFSDGIDQQISYKITYKANKGYFTRNPDGNIYYRVNTPTSLDESGRNYNGLEFREHDNKVKLNIATPPGQRRDLKFPQGIKFERGLYFRTTVEPTYDSTISPGEDTVFVNGGCYIITPNQASISSTCRTRNLNFTVDQESQPRNLNFTPDPVVLERELEFRSETGINGVISLSYNVENETLGIGILVTQSNLQLNDIIFAYDFMGNQLNYEIDTTNYQLNQQIQAEDIEIGSDQVLDSTLNLMFDGNVNLPILLANAFDGCL